MQPDPCPHCEHGEPLPSGRRAVRCVDCGRTYLVSTAPPLAADPPQKTELVESSGPPPEVDPPAVRRTPALTALPETRDMRRTNPEPGRRRAVSLTSSANSDRTAIVPLPEWMAESDGVKPGLTLGGCKLVTRLGSGGMGTVWLARQLSLDRNVAVKVLRPNLGEDLAFVIQFTQEALAAAQLIHHNIAQIYDSGTEGGLHYFTMEYVEGEPLSELVRRRGKLESEVAAGYVLQAARGLKFAHERGLIHRDVKPDNLLLNRDGIVKVADLGLVRRTDEALALRKQEQRKSSNGTPADARLTRDAETAGTPAFMAPEQASGATDADGRADLYSLGCTLYNMVTGRLPFEGETAAQVMSLHFTSDPPPPDKLVPTVPPELSEIILKMMARKPDDRYQDAQEVIDVLEDFLGVEAAGAFSPREEHAAQLEKSVLAFNGASWVRGRRLFAAAYLGLVVALTAGSAALGFGLFAGAVAAVGFATAVSSLLVNAVAQRSNLLLKLRHLLLGTSLVAWGVALGLVCVGLGTLAWFDLLRASFELLGMAVAGTLAFYLVVDRRAARQRRPPLEEVEHMLRGMRLRGLEETALRQFVCQYSGQDWEPFYEALFGYDAKIAARAQWGLDEKGLRRQRRGSWRDPLLRWVNGVMESRQRTKDRQHLEQLRGKTSRRSRERRARVAEAPR